jgi:hypothetical protein
MEIQNIRHTIAAWCRSLGVLGVAIALIHLPAHAATFTVTNLDDSGAGSLRQMILNANAATGADTIVF